jgi:hypothetical protein
MADHRITVPSGALELKGSPAALVVTRVAETWQFFAFVFAAVVTLALTLLDEIPDRHQGWRLAAKVIAFVGLAYVTLVDIRVRGWLSTLLCRFKEERQ